MMLRIGFLVTPGGQREVIMSDMGRSTARSGRIGGTLAVAQQEDDAMARRRIRNREYQRERRVRMKGATA